MPDAELDDLDRYALNRHREVVGRVLEGYDAYEFHVVYHQLVQYCAADLSSFYLDVLKDRLYCDGAGSARRRSAQTVMHRMVRDIALLLSPVLPFTSDEIWPLVPGARESSVHLALFPPGERPDEGVVERWSTLLEVRGAVTKALEEARNAKLCAASLEARVTVKAPAATLAALRRHEDASRVFPGNLANLFIVSQVDLEEANALSVEVARAPGAKCERCWTFSEKVGRLPIHPAVCERCASVLETA